MLTSFFNTGYSISCKILEKESKYTEKIYPSDTVREAMGIMNKIANPFYTLPVKNNSERYKIYPVIMRDASRVIDLLGKQGLALRRLREDISTTYLNSGIWEIFLMLLQEIALCNPSFKIILFLNTLLCKNSTNFSSKSLNKI